MSEVRTRRRWPLALALVVLVGLVPGLAGSAPVAGVDVTYTTTEDFAKGTSVNLNSDVADQLRLNKVTSTFPFIWVALSARGTIAKIDTVTGTVLGEYSTTSDGDGSSNPSRTTVGLDGSAWAGNRNQSSVIHVGLLEANQCVDRNNSGTIETSSGYGDVKPWPGGSGGNSVAVSFAQDECILHYVDTVGNDARHVSVNADGDIWVGSTGTRTFQLVDGTDGSILRPSRAMACGGYGGLVDANGVIWSAISGSQLLRWDPNAPDSETNPRCLSVQNYGLAVDSQGWIWVTSLFGDQVRKVSPDGNTVLGPFSHGSNGAQGIAVDRNDHVWVSSSLFCSGGGCTLGHLKNDGSFVGNVAMPTGGGSTGVAVDAAGKIWTANINSSNATRIDPTAGPLGADEVTPIGAVDLTVPLPDAFPYNYSDMTGAVLLGSTAKQGTWTVVQDGGLDGFRWHTISFNNEKEGFIPAGAEISLSVEARAADSEAGLGAKEFIPVPNCGPVAGLNGRFLQLRVTLKSNAQGETPVLSDLTIRGGPGVPDGECVKPAPKPEPEVLGVSVVRDGYLMAAGDGGVFASGPQEFFGTAKFLGAASAGRQLTAPESLRRLNAAVVGVAVTNSREGYWLATADGGVISIGDAAFAGALAGGKLNKAVTGIAADPDGAGYWLVAEDGGVFAFDAPYFGSMGATALNFPIVDIVRTPSGLGYWLVASDGGVFAFGDADFAGSLGALKLNKGIVSMAPDRDGVGYYLVAGDGGVFAFDADFHGSLGDQRLNAPVVGIATDPDGSGYWLGASDGGVFSFEAPFHGSVAHLTLNEPVAAITAT